MPDLNYQNFEHKSLDADVERLSHEIKEKKNLPEYKDSSEKEVLKQTLQPIIQQQTLKQNEPINKQKKVSSRQSTSKSEIMESEKILPDYLKDYPDDEIKNRVEKLIEMVFNEGLEKAIKEAVKAGGFILDAFHDSLTDKLYDEIKKRNLI